MHALIFDLDGTLVDTVYAHVFAWLSGGYGEDELSRAGAFRVYRDPADLHWSLDELGIVA
jgi:beta-phosphoglucomutase-like phosphatase (HAD superfamily)